MLISGKFHKDKRKGALYTSAFGYQSLSHHHFNILSVNQTIFFPPVLLPYHSTHLPKVFTEDRMSEGILCANKQTCPDRHE